MGFFVVFLTFSVSFVDVFFKNFSYPLFGVAVFCGKLLYVVTVVFIDYLTEYKIAAEQLYRQKYARSVVFLVDFEHGIYTDYTCKFTVSAV